MDTSSVSEQERQSLEAVSRLESTEFPLDEPESEGAWSLVLLELPHHQAQLALQWDWWKGWRTLIFVDQSQFWFLV